LTAQPAFFAKAPTTINVPYGEIPLNGGLTGMPDWEVEVGAVIGKIARNVLGNDRQHAKLARKGK
jgi:2-keto-4-pentenoate hydratase/2-oxohepta-3-ene-1,7-dioic acid hydratase in catechol pathway